MRAPTVARRPAGDLASAGGLDAPVRIEVAMPRALFDRLTDHDDAPRCRYDEYTGPAEFVAVPDMTHEVQTMAAGQGAVGGLRRRAHRSPATHPGRRDRP